MLLNIAILILGLALVVFGSEWLVDGASDVARRSGISEFVIGLTIVGIGTSTPEMVVSFIGAIQGNADISIGNIIGSNIFNTLMILGCTALILPLTISEHAIKRDIPINLGVTLLLILLGCCNPGFENTLSRVDGAIMLLLFAAYLYMSFKEGREPDSGEETGDTTHKSYSHKAIPITMIIVGLASLIAGGRLFVNSAVEIAHALGWSDKFIGITILAGGTSLPELATCVVAAFKKKGQLALGNILGSNISNILLILGGSALIHPLSMENISTVDLGTLFLSALLIFVSYYTFVKKKLGRVEAVCLLLMEAAYMYTLITDL